MLSCIIVKSREDSGGASAKAVPFLDIEASCER